MRLFTSLNHRPFALLWSGQSISLLGDAIYQVTLAWWVLQKTGSAVIVATVFIFSFTPMVLFLLLGGVVVDRFPRMQLMLSSDVLRGLVVSVVALLAFTQHLQVWHIYTASLLFGFVDAFFQPAYTAAIPEMMPMHLLPSANSLTSMSANITGILGPGLGAFIVLIGGTPLAFALDGLSFFISAACVAPLVRSSQPSVVDGEQKHILHDVQEGIKIVLASPWLWVNIAVASVTTLTNSAPYFVTMPFLVKERLHAGVGTLGFIYSLTAIGSIIAAIWLGRATRIRHRGFLAFGAYALSGVVGIAFGLPLPLVVILCVAGLGGAFGSIGELIWTNTLQELVPRDKLGRVSSIDLLCTRVPLPIGYAIAGVATQHFGPATVFLVAGSITACVCLLGLAHPAIRKVE